MDFGFWFFQLAGSGFFLDGWIMIFLDFGLDLVFGLSQDFTFRFQDIGFDFWSFVRIGFF
jgi:hypothetical protein